MIMCPISWRISSALKSVFLIMENNSSHTYDHPLQRFIWAFVQSKLNWTPRKGTHAAAHLPADAEDQCEVAFFWLVYAMKWENVPPKVSANLYYNETLLTIYAACHWHGSNWQLYSTQQQLVISCLWCQTSGYCSEGWKEGIHSTVASTPDGDFLPWQQVWSGATKML